MNQIARVQQQSRERDATLLGNHVPERFRQEMGQEIETLLEAQLSQ